MNVKTETVRFMAGSTPLDKIFHSLLGRVFVAVLQTVLSSVVFLLTFFFWQPVEITLLKYTLVVGIGLIAGFSARRFLKSNTQILKVLVALGSTALSLVILFVLSRGFMGINLFYQVNDNPDWGGLIQFGIAGLPAWLVIYAFRRAPVIEEIPISGSLPQITRAPSIPGINLSLPKLSRPARKKVKKSILKTTAPPKLSVAPVLKPEVKKPTKVKKKRPRKKAVKDIKFSSAIEHTCPYCLDPVEPNDARGVKVCSVCKTHHHADCWGITGACQIPHSQE